MSDNIEIKDDVPAEYRHGKITMKILGKHRVEGVKKKQQSTLALLPTLVCKIALKSKLIQEMLRYVRRHRQKFRDLEMAD